jgi:hypothetical protein
MGDRGNLLDTNVKRWDSRLDNGGLSGLYTDIHYDIPVCLRLHVCEYSAERYCIYD